MLLEQEACQAFDALVRKMDPQSTLLRTWQLKGGVSAQVTGIEIARADGSTKKWIVRQHGVIDRRRNPNIAADEFRLLQILRDQGLPTPTPYFLEESGTIFNTPCIVLEYIEGETDFAPNNLEDYLYQLSAQLARIHGIRGGVLSFLPQQTRGFGERPANLDDSLEEGRIRDTLESLWPLPQRNEAVLLHGDFWPGNVLWRDGQLVAVIDYTSCKSLPPTPGPSPRMRGEGRNSGDLLPLFRLRERGVGGVRVEPTDLGKRSTGRTQPSGTHW